MTAARKPQIPSRRRGLPRSALLTIGALVLLVVGFGVKLWLDAAQQTEARQALLAETEQALAASPLDADALSRCLTRLRELPDHAEAADLLMAQARIELARDHADRAEGLFLALATAPNATPAQQGLGARIMLRRQESGGLDPSAARAALQQVLQLAQASYAGSNDPEDLLVAWQAALRLSDPAVKDLATRLQQHADSPAAQLAQAGAAFDPQKGPAPLDALVRAFPVAPAELGAMRAVAVLQTGDVLGAVQIAEAALLQAPGVSGVRWVAAVAFHSGAVGSPEGSADRQRFAARRDVQLDWLQAAQGLAGERAEQAVAMRAVR